MTIKQMLKKNKLFVIVALVYMVLFVTMPEKANEALGNSVYYLIEMLEVLPVIFLLTVVIEVLIPKEWIMKHFGENSGLMGNLLSLLLGSISAGPIYAAFPISKTLLGKGASVSNIVIILSTWAVIKIPMLANEAKFLGASFMGIRWVLTVIAILLMAWVIGKIVSKKELITETLDSTKSKVYVNEDYCVGCGICSKMLPEVYKIVDRKAKVNLSNIHPSHRIMIVKTIEKCPTKAIVMNMDRTSVH